MMTESITWRDAVAGLPDADTNTLCFSEAIGVFEGFLDDQDDAGAPIWRDVTALQVHGVSHWAEMPTGPAA